MKSSCSGPMRMNEKIQYAHTATTTLKTMATPVSFQKSRATRSTPRGELSWGCLAKNEERRAMVTTLTGRRRAATEE